MTENTLFSRYPVQVFNSMARKTEIFEPINSPRVGMYVCGPTVYGEPHLGHARAALTFDVVFRHLSYLGYKVRYVRNITDVGHLENEISDQGEDKIAKKARLEEIEPMEVVQRYTNSYHEAMQAMNMKAPSIEPTATGHLLEQMAMIQKILDSGFAYEKSGSVYFDLDKYSKTKNYGKLSGKILEDLVKGSRDLEGQEEKKNPLDFALWKKAEPGHVMKWNSVWSEGFPGWHLECSTMSVKYLGLPFDIHGGGMDLQFPHHECEIAQSVAAEGIEPVRFWMHNNMLTINGQKMSKSLGNFITLSQLFSGKHPLLDQAYSPMTVRFFMLQAHYRSTLDFSNEALKAAEKGLRKLEEAMDAWDHLPEPLAEGNPELNERLNKICENCHLALSQDFNTPQALGHLFELANEGFSLRDGHLHWSELSKSTVTRVRDTYRIFFSDILGLVRETGDTTGKLNTLVELLIRLRKQARDTKNYDLGDQIRVEMAAAGVQLKDGKDGETTFRFQ